jgi:hypothetical protein
MTVAVGDEAEPVTRVGNDESPFCVLVSVVDDADAV